MLDVLYTKQTNGRSGTYNWIHKSPTEREKERDFLYIVLNKISVGFVFMSSIAVEEIVSN